MSNDTQPAASPAPAAETPAAAPAAAPVQPAAPAAQPATLLTGGQPPAVAAPAQPEAKPGEPPTAEAKPAETPPGAPEAYADFTAPEGVKFNDETMAEFKAFAKEKNLSQEDAQKLVDLGIKQNESNMTALTGQIRQAQAKWSVDSQADPEFGGDNLQKNLAIAGIALKEFGTPALTELLDSTGLGNHPEINRVFFRMGQLLKQDNHVPGGPKPAASDPLTTMYPTMTKGA